MNGQAGFTLRGRNPDVLTCIANLSNDEVFTPSSGVPRLGEHPRGLLAELGYEDDAIEALQAAGVVSADD